MKDPNNQQFVLYEVEQNIVICQPWTLDKIKTFCDDRAQQLF